MVITPGGCIWEHNVLWESSRLLAPLGFLHDSALSPRDNVNMDTGQHRYWARLELPQGLLVVCLLP